MKILWDLKILWETGSRGAKILWDFVSQCEVWHVCNWSGSALFAIKYIDWLRWGLMTHQPLRVILCHLLEKGRKEIEETAEETKEKDRRKEEQEWKWRNRRNKNIPPLPLPATRIAGLAQP